MAVSLAKTYSLASDPDAHHCCHGCYQYVHWSKVLPGPLEEFKMAICTACEHKVAGLTHHLKYPAPPKAVATPASRGWRMKCGCYSEECDGFCGPWSGSTATDRVRWYVEHPDAKFRADETPHVTVDAERLRALLAEMEAGKDVTIPRGDEYVCWERVRQIRKKKKTVERK